MRHLYPHDLVAPLRAQWIKPRPKPYRARTDLPTDEHLASLLSIAYQTSLLKEEGRRLTFRVLVMRKPTQSGAKPAYGREPRIVQFNTARPYSIGELRRLAPAAETTRSLIAVSLNRKGEWEIWGLVDIGANWWEFIHHEAHGGRPPPEGLTITSAGPGELICSSAGDPLLTLRSGRIYEPQAEALYRGDLSDHFTGARRSLYREAVRALGTKKWDAEGQDDDYPMRFYTFCLARILNAVHEKGHGGTVLFVPDALSANDSRLQDRIQLKYPSTYDYVWKCMVDHLVTHKRFYDLHLPMWNSKDKLDPDDVRRQFMLESQREEIDEALTDCFKLLGCMSAVDGALVLTDRFRVLGFGGEITAQSPTLTKVRVEAVQPGSASTSDVTVEGYGTRHRSAFRFCSSYEQSVAFVVSQDGGVKGVKRVGQGVHMWPDLSLTPYGV